MVADIFKDGDAGILIWKMDESEDELRSGLMNFVYYESEFLKISSLKRRLEFLTARVALQTLTGSEVRIVYDAEGKPSVADDLFRISISHTGKWVAVIVHPSAAVGVDIELPSDKFKTVYKRFLSPDEQSYLYCPDDLRKVQIAWSVKEALYKIIGHSAVCFDKDLTVNDFQLTDNGEIFTVHNPVSTVYRLIYKRYDDFYLVYSIQS